EPVTSAEGLPVLKDLLAEEALLHLRCIATGSDLRRKEPFSGRGIGGQGPSPSIVRESLHPLFAPCSYGEDIFLPGQEKSDGSTGSEKEATTAGGTSVPGGLLVSLDRRTQLGPVTASLHRGVKGRIRTDRGDGDGVRLAFWKGNNVPGASSKSPSGSRLPTPSPLYLVSSDGRVVEGMGEETVGVGDLSAAEYVCIPRTSRPSRSSTDPPIPSRDRVAEIPDAFIIPGNTSTSVSYSCTAKVPKKAEETGREIRRKLSREGKAARALRLVATRGQGESGGDGENGTSFSVDSEGVLECKGGFPSAALDGVALSSGRWYYEVEIVRPGVAQVGWATLSFMGNDLNGVGDDHHSWGFDGRRVRLWHRGTWRSKWGVAWVKGDVVGVAVDLEERRMHFSLNGSFAAPMGPAFEGISCDSSIRPCVTLNNTCGLRLRFGGPGNIPLLHKPPLGYQAVGNAPDRGMIAGSEAWGYRFEVTPFVGLRLVSATSFRLLGATVEERTGVVGAGEVGTVVTVDGVGGGCVRGHDVALWRPETPHNAAMFCDAVGRASTPSPPPPGALMVVAEKGNPLLAPPKEYVRVWTSKIQDTETGRDGTRPPPKRSPGSLSGSIWRPVAPEGFVSMGDVYNEDSADAPPSLPLFRCVRRDQVEPAQCYPVVTRSCPQREGREWENEHVGVHGEQEERFPVGLWVVENQMRSFVYAAESSKLRNDTPNIKNSQREANSRGGVKEAHVGVEESKDDGEGKVPWTPDR
ncbi:unnamed protein product, partial [Discosporangium mesarthrocarpum]